MDRKLTHGAFDLIHTGVTTDKNTPLNAAIMSATVLLYLIIQVPRGSVKILLLRHNMLAERWFVTRNGMTPIRSASQ